jgi:CitMHS family citrate-Mg2+:H+ or citrate-Ca2+:H+ symporter
MSDVGVFDAIVNKLMKAAGKNVTAVMLATAAMAVIIHLDGAGAATFLITMTAMVSVYQRMNLDRRNLMLIVCLSIGVMNVLPWAGPTIRAAVVLKMEAVDLWRPLIPIQLINIGIVFVITFFLSRIQKRELRVAAASGTLQEIPETPKSSDGAAKAAAAPSAPAPAPTPAAPERLIDTSRWGLMAFNYILTAAVIAILVLDVIPAPFTFMIGLALALVVNVRSLDVQNSQLKKYGVTAMTMVVTLFSAGVFIGVFSSSGMLDKMALAIVGAIPPGLGHYTHIIIAFLAVPLIMCLGTDAFYYGLLPVVIGVCKNFDVTPEHVAQILIIAENIGIMVSPMTPSLYIGLALVNLDLGDHIRYALPWIWGFSIISILVSLAIGIVPL